MSFNHSEEHLRAWLQLSLAPRLPHKTLRDLLAQFGLPETVTAQTHHALKLIAGEAAASAIKTPSEATLKLIDDALIWAAQPNCSLVAWGHFEYPEQLLTIQDSPPVLYVMGQTAALAQPTIGVVGSRNATMQGIDNAKAFSQTLAGAGLVISSGLALGVDTAAHEGALASGSALATVAVIGTGIDRVYPARNRDLAHRIIERGAIVSEFPIGTPPLRQNFPIRNRLISGLAQGVLVIEAAAQSGSLITARVAGEQGREIFAIPGSIHSPLAKGCHQLIKQGAKLVDDAKDILEDLKLSSPTALVVKPKTLKNAAPSSNAVHAAVLDALGYEPANLEQLISRTQLPATQLLTALTELELFGDIALLDGARYQKRSA